MTQAEGYQDLSLFPQDVEPSRVPLLSFKILKKILVSALAILFKKIGLSRMVLKSRNISEMRRKEFWRQKAAVYQEIISIMKKYHS